MKQLKGFVPGKKLSEYTKEEIDKILKTSKLNNRKPGFFDNMQVHYCQYEIDKDWLNSYQDIDSLPLCYTCNKSLGIGDYRDGHHPYHNEYNACEEHKDDYSNSLYGDTDS